MNPPLQTRPQNFINRIQNQAAIILKKSSMQIVIKQISLKANATCLQMQDCSAEGVLDLEMLELKNLKKISIIKCPNIQNVLLSSECAQKLQDIEWSQNQSTQIPQFIQRCINVSQINLSNNLIQHFPHLPFKNLHKLQSIIIYGNPLHSINASIYHRFGTQRFIFEWKMDLFEQDIATKEEEDSYSDSMSEHPQQNICLSKQMIQKYYRTHIHQQLSSHQEQQIKILVTHQHSLYLSNILPALNNQECYQILTLCQRMGKYELFDAVLNRLSRLVSPKEAKQQQGSKFIFHRLMTLNIYHISAHKKSLASISLYDVIKFLNQAPISPKKQANNQKFIALVKDKQIKRYLFDQTIISDKTFLCFLTLLSNKHILSLLVKNQCISYIWQSSYDEDILKELISGDSWDIINYFMKIPEFKNNLFKNSHWKSMIRPHSIIFKYLLRQQKKYVRDTLESAKYLHFPQYKPPKSYMLRNDVHDYLVLKSYEEFQASFQRKDFKITVRYFNKQNHFSIAGKIKKQITIKDELNSQRYFNKRKSGIRVTRSDTKIMQQQRRSLFKSEAISHENFCSAPFSTRFCDENLGNLGNLANSMVIECSEFDLQEAQNSNTGSSMFQL